MARLRVIACGSLLVAGLALAGGVRAQPPAKAGGAAAGGRYIVLYDGSVGDAAGATTRRERSQGFRARLRYSNAVKGFAATLTAQQADSLRADARVRSVTEDRIVTAAAAVARAPGESQAPSGVRRIEAATSTTVRESSSVNVAVIDTGIDLDHSDLDAHDGRNCVTPGAPADDDHGHGTHVAGTIAARNDGAGVVGVAPGTRVFAVKVLNAAGSGTMSQVVCGIDWVTSTMTDGNPGNDVPVANMSLGASGSPLSTCAATGDPMHRAICASTAAGTTYVVAAGNSGWNLDDAAAPDVPAAYPQVLTVTAMSDNDGLPGGLGPSCSSRADEAYADFSNYALTAAASEHVIAAPGNCIYSTTRGGGHGTMSGTSMASPHVAGAVALCIGEAGAQGYCAGLSPAQIITKLRADAQSRSTTDGGYGFGGDPLRPAGGRYFGHLVALPALPLAADPAPAPGADVPSVGGWSTPPGVNPLPAPPLKDAPAAELAREAAGLQVRRTAVRANARTLEVLASISSFATGAIDVTFEAGGTRTRFSQTIRAGSDSQRIVRTIPRVQARSATGILTLRYRGDDRTRPQEIRLLTAARSARLVAQRPRLAAGRLVARGTVTAQARGVVRVQLDWSRGGRQRRHAVDAGIRGGRWQLTARLPASVRSDIAARDGALQADVLFGGYEPRRIRGEMRSFEVLGAR